MPGVAGVVRGTGSSSACSAVSVRRADRRSNVDAVRSLLDAASCSWSTDDPLRRERMGASFGRALVGVNQRLDNGDVFDPINGLGMEDGYAQHVRLCRPPVASSPNEARSIPESGPIWWSSMSVGRR